MADAETEFIAGMMQLHFGVDTKASLLKLAPYVPWARGWPEDPEAFWNAEAFMWGYQIPKDIRQAIAEEIAFLAKGKNLDLGCGAYSYITSVGFDISPLMLRYNERCSAKIVGDVEQLLPFRNNEFDSVTAIFLLNYVARYQQLLVEIRRVLRPQGRVMIVLARQVQAWQRTKQQNALTIVQWKALLEKQGFSVSHYQKQGLFFLQGKKLLKEEDTKV